jgi:hypothetical protein
MQVLGGRASWEVLRSQMIFLKGLEGLGSTLSTFCHKRTKHSFSSEDVGTGDIVEPETEVSGASTLDFPASRFVRISFFLL